MAIENSFVYSLTPVDQTDYNKFDFGYGKYFTAKPGKFYPLHWEEIEPGANIHSKIQHFARTQPLVAPSMIDMNIETFSFLVPFRIIFDGWQEFISFGDGKTLKNDLGINSQIPYITTQQLLQYFAHDLSCPWNLGFKPDNCNYYVTYKDLYQCCELLDIPMSNLIDIDEFQSYDTIKTFILQTFTHFSLTDTGQKFTIDQLFTSQYVQIFDDLNIHTFPVNPQNFATLHQITNSASTNLAFPKYSFSKKSIWYNALNLYHDKEYESHDTQLYYDNKETYDTSSSSLWRTRLLNKLETNNIRSYWLYKEGDTKPSALWFATTPQIKTLNNSFKFAQSKINLLPFFAKQKVYEDWFRCEPFETEYSEYTIFSGKVTELPTSEFVKVLHLSPAHYKRDYFQAALPQPTALQQVFVPFSSPIDLPGISNPFSDNRPVTLQMNSDKTLFAEYKPDPTRSTIAERVENLGDHILTYDNESNPSYLTVNSIRESFALQDYLETLNAVGNRYVEMMYSMYGVQVPDAVVKRPLYLNHDSDILKISDVESNSQTLLNNNEINTPLGTLAGKGIAYSTGSGYNIQASEFCILISFMRISPPSIYFQGLPRKFMHFDPLDFYNHKFAHLGEQETFQGEIYFTGKQDDDSKVFGYMPRFSEYRGQVSRSCGELNTNLHYWLPKRIFNGAPKLGSNFSMQHPNDTIDMFTNWDQNYDSIIFQSYIKIDKSSRIPVYPIPSHLCIYNH
ncbi:major capsid protein [Capybara microvirus Cap1_SP_64]|nr:major capsid protein [Capybara microvirus Cap1_SP_64]